jgi:hypothetical protein
MTGSLPSFCKKNLTCFNFIQDVSLISYTYVFLIKINIARIAFHVTYANSSIDDLYQALGSCSRPFQPRFMLNLPQPSLLR